MPDKKIKIQSKYIEVFVYLQRVCNTFTELRN